MEWITSDGGPLIALPQSKLHSWRGVDGLGAHNPRDERFTSDYARACSVKDYLGVIEVSGRAGIVLGEMPLDTTVMLAASGLPLIVRVFYSEPDADIANMASSIMPENATAVERVSISVDEPHWLIIDSAYPGQLVAKKALRFDLPPNELAITTFECKPDPQTFLLLHRFEHFTNTD